MRSLVLLRHGESTWNREGRFTGWTDVGLTDRGLDQAAAAAAALLEHGYAVRPPALLPEDERSAARDPRYAELPPRAIRFFLADPDELAAATRAVEEEAR